jgi:hypothetical protein
MSEFRREATLQDLLDDPLTLLVMERDGMGPKELRAVLAAVALRRFGPPGSTPPGKPSRWKNRQIN